MKTIWKFKLEIRLHQTLSMPKDARVLKIDVQGDSICIWAEVDPHATKSTRQFIMVGTGQMIPDFGNRMMYLETIQQNLLVWHIYEVV